MSTTWVALLRGINVGGRNRILMADLRACFEDQGYSGVRTYIQSGNVIFGADATDREALRSAIEAMLATAFDYAATVELRSREELQAVVDDAPKGYGSDKDTYHYDILFLLPPLTTRETLDALRPRDGVDEVWVGPDVVYHRRLAAQASRSGLPKIVSHPTYQRMTVRNWNTTTRLLAMMSEGQAPSDT